MAVLAADPRDGGGFTAGGGRERFDDGAAAGMVLSKPAPA